MLPEYQLKGELVISVPRHRHPRATITAGKGWGIWRFTHTSQACRARPRTTRHARTCNGASVEYMAREQVTTVPRRQARGGHVACAPAGAS